MLETRRESEGSVLQQRPESPGLRGRVGQGPGKDEGGTSRRNKGNKAMHMYDKSAIAERLYADVKLD